VTTSVALLDYEVVAQPYLFFNNWVGHSGAQSRQGGVSNAGWTRGSARTRGGKYLWPSVMRWGNLEG